MIMTRGETLRNCGLVLMACALLAAPASVALAQTDDLLRPGMADDPGPAPAAPPAAPATPGDNTTVIPRSDGAGAGETSGRDDVQFVALLTADGQRIEQGLVWRVYAPLPQQGKVKLLSTHQEANPSLRLKPGDYVVNAAFGRAYLTRRISVKGGSGAPAVEQFVLNAGGLRVAAKLGAADAPPESVHFNIYSDRDQQDNRRTIMLNAKPGVIVRLNAGIYQIKSTYGDANATVKTDVTVEAGKLTEAQLTHAAARATFKLVARTGGEAIADTQWRIETGDGQLVKEAVGAFPTHMLAPGKYVAVAKHGGRIFKREFTLEDAAQDEVEVLIE